MATADYTSPDHPLQKAHIGMSLKKLFALDKERTCHRLVTQVVNECIETMHEWLADNRGIFGTI